MSSLKTCLHALVAVAIGAGPVLATQPDMSRIFAGCAGRFSAEMEHAWLVNSDAAQSLAEARGQFVSLVEATAPTHARRAILGYRVEVKMAHAALLTQATFGTDQGRALSARSAATGHLDVCKRLLLGG